MVHEVSYPMSRTLLTKHRETASTMSRALLPKLESTNAKFPHLAHFYQRIQSYVTWRKNSGVSVKSLVESGFFFSGFKDRVQCFFCGGIIENWNEGDIVDEEHQRLMPHCDFINNKMLTEHKETKNLTEQKETIVTYNGMSDKDLTSASYGHDVPASYGHDVPAPASLSRERSVLPPYNPPRHTAHHPVAPRDIRARLDTDMSQKLVQMGFKKALLAQVIGERLAETGDDFPTFMDYFKAVKVAENVLCTGNALEDYYHRTMEVVQKPVVAPPAPPEPVQPQSISGPTSTGSGASDDSLKRKKECKICMDKEADTVFMPCRHMCACEGCAKRLKKCPLCRKSIQQCIKVYS